MRFFSRMPLSLIPLVLAALALVGVEAWVLRAMTAQTARARQVTEELREAYEVSQRLIQARALLDLGGESGPTKAQVRLAAAEESLGRTALPALLAARVRSEIAQARGAGGAAAINRGLNALAGAIGDLRREAEQLDDSAKRLGLWGVVGVGVLVLATAGATLVVGLEMQRGLERKVRRQAAELARAERPASVGFLAAGVAHEINNPLAIILAEAELAQRPGADPTLAEALTVIREEAARCKAITARLLETARGGGAREDLDLLAEAKSAVALAQKLEQARACAVTVEGGFARAFAEPGPLRQVLLNLVVNAMEAAPQGRVVVRVSADGPRSRVEVRDDGAGIASADLPRIFEPFFTTKRNPATPGLGLGLAVAQAIVSAQGGKLAAHSDGPGLGSVFTVELDASRPAVSAFGGSR
jgi:signal transduction histidine kinase